MSNFRNKIYDIKASHIRNDTCFHLFRSSFMAFNNNLQFSFISNYDFLLKFIPKYYLVCVSNGNEIFISVYQCYFSRMGKTIDIYIFILSPTILQIPLFILVVYWGSGSLSVHKYDCMVSK